jgi:plasmid stabilization system protein ParE
VRQIRWTTEASDQLEAAIQRIQQDNSSAARNLAQTVIDRIEQLATFPSLGPPGGDA